MKKDKNIQYKCILVGDNDAKAKIKLPFIHFPGQMLQWPKCTGVLFLEVTRVYWDDKDEEFEVWCSSEYSNRPV